MEVPYILQGIIALLVFAMFCLGMHCISRSTEAFRTHEGFATGSDDEPPPATGGDSEATPATDATDATDTTDTTNTQQCKHAQEDGSTESAESTLPNPPCPAPQPFPLTMCTNTATNAQQNDTTKAPPHQHHDNPTNDLEQKRPPPPDTPPPPPSPTEDPHGYTIRHPSTWAVPHRRAPVCMPTAHPEVRPVYTDGVPLYALEVKGFAK